MERVKMESMVYSSPKNNSNKFYILELIKEDGMFSVKSRYGRLGKNPTIKEKTFNNLFSALKFFEKKESEKKTKGYLSVAIEDIVANSGEFFVFD